MTLGQQQASIGQQPDAAQVAHQHAVRASEILAAVHNGMHGSLVANALAEAGVSATLAVYYQSLAATMADPARERA
jgi:hypothetical protein